MDYTILKVEGMTCSHCEASVTKNLLNMNGIEEVHADKNKSEVSVKGNKIDLAAVEKTITDLGYAYKGIKLK